MKQIKFRAKVLGDEDKEWVYGYVVKKACRFCDEWHIHTMKGEVLQINPSTIGQYTNSEANDIEIYEGDIVHRFSRSAGESTAVVEFNEQKAYPALFSNGNDEVIGNVHETPELIPEQK